MFIYVCKLYSLNLSSKYIDWLIDWFLISQNCVEMVYWKDIDLSSIKISSRKVHQNDVDFLPIEITLKKVHQNNIDSLLIDITSNKVYVKTMWISCPSKSHWKNMSKWRGNFSIFSSRCIDVIPKSNWFDVLYPLGVKSKEKSSNSFITFELETNGKDCFC